MVPVALTKTLPPKTEISYYWSGKHSRAGLQRQFSISPETQVIDFGKFNLLDIRATQCRKHSVLRRQNHKMTNDRRI